MACPRCGNVSSRTQLIDRLPKLASRYSVTECISCGWVVVDNCLGELKTESSTLGSGMDWEHAYKKLDQLSMARIEELKKENEELKTGLDYCAANVGGRPCAGEAYALAKLSKAKDRIKELEANFSLEYKARIEAEDRACRLEVELERAKANLLQPSIPSECPKVVCGGTSMPLCTPWKAFMLKPSM